mmetsp:Transcript_24515/g.43712  ORF Transcript_24515/g.43712 Transcript_24515/m.43712 type:complete len:88 (-) Transcript_24515:563-826(-)
MMERTLESEPLGEVCPEQASWCPAPAGRPKDSHWRSIALMELQSWVTETARIQGSSKLCLERAQHSARLEEEFLGRQRLVESPCLGE